MTRTDSIAIAVEGAESANRQTALHSAMTLLDRHLSRRKLRPAGDAAAWKTREIRPGRYVTAATVRAIPQH